jgi:hypothetical protein
MDQKNMVFIYNELYSATKKNETLSFAGKWIEQGNIMLTEVSQAQQTKKSYVLCHMAIIHLKQIQQYYGTWVILRGG